MTRLLQCSRDIFHSEAVRADGNAVLGAVACSKDASRTLAARARPPHGLDAAQIASDAAGPGGRSNGELALRAEISLDAACLRSCPRSGA